MLVKKTDIGADIIHILTKGMYLDPKDTIREYIQNGVDAKAKDISIKIRQGLIVIQDDGTGMDKDTMRKSIRIGISEKNPSTDVGFMGIGIYSAYHLCRELHIYSKVKGGIPHLIKFDFKGMREKLEVQRELRFNSKLEETDVIALQDLLDEFISMNEISKSDFPKTGTRVELLGISKSFFKTISEFKEISEYLEKVVPLTFNPEFYYGREIQAYISQFCKDHNLEFSLINLSLQINDEQRQLHRPYLNDHFEPHAMEPVFHAIWDNNEIYGIAWGCLNGSKHTIKNKDVRGFVIKKQGFTIGESKDLLPYFGRQTYFNRYIGEVIVVHPKLLPNASRSEFEYSTHRVIFQDLFREVAQDYNKYADKIQEELKALEELDKAIRYLKESKARLNQIVDNSDNLLVSIWECKEFIHSLNTRNSQKKFQGENEQKASLVISQLESFATEISSHIETTKKKKKQNKKSESEIIEDIEEVPETTQSEEIKSYDSFIQIIESLGLDLTQDLMKIFEFLDEEFIRFHSDDDDDYKNQLKKLRDNLDELLNE